MYEIDILLERIHTLATTALSGQAHVYPTLGEIQNLVRDARELTRLPSCFWQPEDVFDRAIESERAITMEEAREILMENKKNIEEDMCKYGWDSIDYAIDDWFERMKE